MKTLLLAAMTGAIVPESSSSILVVPSTVDLSRKTSFVAAAVPDPIVSTALAEPRATETPRMSAALPVFSAAAAVSPLVLYTFWLAVSSLRRWTAWFTAGVALRRSTGQSWPVAVPVLVATASGTGAAAVDVPAAMFSLAAETVSPPTAVTYLTTVMAQLLTKMPAPVASSAAMAAVTVPKTWRRSSPVLAVTGRIEAPRYGSSSTSLLVSAAVTRNSWP